MSRLTVRPALAVLIAVALVGGAIAGVAVAQEETPTDGAPTPTDGTPTAEPVDQTPTEEPVNQTTTEESVEETPTETPMAGEQPEESYVRVLHASPDAPAVDVYVENETFLTNFSFGNVSDYVVLAPGNYSVTITAAGDRDAVVFDDVVSLDPGATTLAATGEVRPNTATDFEVVAYANDASRPDEDQSELSIVHLSPDAPAVDVTTADGVLLAENVTFRNATNYVTVPSGNYTVQVRAAAADNDGPVVATANASLAGGSAYSALALGYVAPAENVTVEQPFQVALVEDATLVTENGTTTVQLPDAGDEMGEPTPTPTEAAPEPSPTESGEATPTEAAPEPSPTEPGDATPTEAAPEPTPTDSGMDG